MKPINGHLEHFRQNKTLWKIEQYPTFRTLLIEIMNIIGNIEHFKIVAFETVAVETKSPVVEFSGLKIGIMGVKIDVGEGIVSPLSVSPFPQYL